MDKEILYIADPMCSWCWGFAPSAQQLQRHFSGIAQFTLVLGGLRPGDRAQPLDDGLKHTIRPHWERVAEVTGQPFDFGLFDREGFLFDTEPASRAVVAVRRIAPDRTMPFFFALQRAFYQDGVDVTDAANFVSLVEQQGLDAARFTAEFGADAVRTETYADFATAAQLGARGFPTVVLRNGGELALLTAGYQPFERLIGPAQGYLAAPAAPADP